MGVDAMQWLKGLVAAGAAGEAAAVTKEVSRFEFWRRLRIDASRNPIECDCQLTDELALVTHVTTLLNTSSPGGEGSTTWWGLNCSQPPVFQGFSLGEFLAYSVCPVEIGYASCPDACDCRFDVRGKGSRYLNCSRRHLSTVPGFEPGYFNAVDLSYNDLTEIPDRYFLSANHVVYLDLSHNRLRSLPSNALAQMSSLRQLFLHQNDLAYLPSEIENLPRLKFLSIQGNPLSCDCGGYAALRSITTTLRRVVSDILRVRCADGRLLWRLNLTQATDTTDDCRPTTPVDPAAGDNDTKPHRPLVVVIGSLVLIAVASAVVVVVLLSRPKSGNNTFSQPRGGSWKKLENQDDQQLLRYDIFVSYCDLDDAWVTGTLLDAIWSESSQYSVSLQQHQPCPSTTVDLPAADNFRRSIESSKVTVVVLSDRFLKTIWSEDSYRSIILEKLESQRHQFIFIHMEKVDVEEQARDLHGLLPGGGEGDRTLRATDPLFAEKLAYCLPSPLRPSRSSAAADDHTDSTSGLLVELTEGPQVWQVKCSREKY